VLVIYGSIHSNATIMHGIYNTIQIFLFPIKEHFRAEQLTKNLIQWLWIDYIDWKMTTFYETNKSKFNHAYFYANKICLVQSFVASIRKFESVTDVDFKLYLNDIKSKWWKMNEAIRRPEQVSPKSSPRGSRSPAYPRGDSTGTLKTTIMQVHVFKQHSSLSDL
jgi:hypothetical protein